MSILQWIRGTLTAEIVSAEPEKLLETIASAGIPISDIQKKNDLSYRFRISRKEFHHILPYFQKRDDILVILSRNGLFWKVKSLLLRPYLLSALLIILTLTLYLPTKMLFVEVEGNHTISTTEILTAAEHCGISFGTSRKQILSEKVKNQLLSLIPELQWAGINTKGCRAVLSVRERSKPETGNSTGIVSSIVARQDAYILSATVTSGVSMVHPGDSVTEGQTLVSGYADHGNRIVATRATGDIIGLTNRNCTAVLPQKYLQTTETGDAKYRISLLIRKKRINLWKDSRISDASCGRMYEEYFVSLPGGYQLPVAICVDRYFGYRIESLPVPETYAHSELQNLSDVYLTRQMIAGQILHKYQKLTHSLDAYMLESQYICSEMIGREQREQIGDQNGKRN